MCLPKVHFLSSGYAIGRRKVQPEREDGEKEMKPRSENSGMRHAYPQCGHAATVYRYFHSFIVP